MDKGFLPALMGSLPEEGLHGDEVGLPDGRGPAAAVAWSGALPELEGSADTTCVSTPCASRLQVSKEKKP